MNTVFLSDFYCPTPPYQKSQSESFQWLQNAYRKYQKSEKNSDYSKILQKVGVSEKQIGRRGYFLEDFHREFSDSEIFSDRQRGIASRQDFYLRCTTNIFENLYGKRKFPDHLIHVSCTGYISPSPGQLLAARKSPDSVVTHSYHMGCYGAFPALRMGSGFLNSGLARRPDSVDVIHTELCTLHLNPEDPTLEQILVQTLFSDGVAAYKLSLDKPETGFEILCLDEYLIPDSDQAMSWSLAESGFVMSLSKNVPQLIADNLRSALEKWEKKSAHFKIQDLKKAVVAVHPGGPKIIDFVRDTLELNEEQIRFSRKVLFEKGNMSSATVPHIWNEVLMDASVPPGTPVVSMAFGPGLTLCLGLLRVVR